MADTDYRNNKVHFYSNCHAKGVDGKTLTTKDSSKVTCETCKEYLTSP
jgi:hypothetical protein